MYWPTSQPTTILTVIRLVLSRLILHSIIASRKKRSSRQMPASVRFLTLSLGEALPSMEGAAKTRLLRQYKRLPAQSLSEAASSNPMTRNSAYVKSIRFCGAVDCVGRCPTNKTGRRMTAVPQEATKGPRSDDRPHRVDKGSSCRVLAGSRRAPVELPGCHEATFVRGVAWTLETTALLSKRPFDCRQ